MQLKVKHKMTFDYPDLLTVDMNRSNRKTKTMLKSFRATIKQSSQYQSLTNPNHQNQKQIKSLVQTSIQQLHQKMKSFFNNQRLNHLQLIAPQLQLLNTNIISLKQQLNRPKSMAQIQQEKHHLLKRKVLLLKQIEIINKQVKSNNNLYYQLKFLCQDLDRQLKNGYATIKKYKNKLQANNNSQNNNNSQTDNNNQSNLSSIINNDSNKQNNNMTKILNQSILNNQSINNQNYNINQLSYNQNNINQSNKLNKNHSEQQNDHVYITQVINQKDNKLPIINNIHKKKTSSNNQSLQIKKTYSMTPNMLNKKKKNQLSYAFQNELTEQIKLTSKHNSNTSFDEYQRYNTLQTSINDSDYIRQRGINNDKYTKKNPLTLDLTLQIKKYEQLVNKQKWNHIQSLFNKLDHPQSLLSNYQSVTPQSHDFQNVTNNNNSKNVINEQNSSSQYSSYNDISRLQQLLMQQLRRQQYQSYKQKGYHQGLKDKTHQIKIQIKKIFKNYSPDHFFNNIINKKTIKKQLSLILDHSTQ